jgi:hypothetical protein
MKTLSRVLVGLVLAFGLMSPVFAGYEDLFTEVKKSSWAIYQRSTGGMNAICSAGAYKTDKNHTWLVSAGHCFMGQDLNRTDFLVTQNHKNFVKARVYRMGLSPKKGADETSTDMDKYRGKDWAIVEIDAGDQTTFPLGKSDDLQLGEDLVIVGVPFGMDFLAVQGIVGSKDLALSQTAWNHAMGANVFIAGGNSGSAVISVKQKAIVGIIVAGPGSQSSLAIFTQIKDVNTEVKE